MAGAVAGGGDVGDAEVDAEEGVGFGDVDVGDVAGGRQQPQAVAVDEVGFASAVGDQRAGLFVGAAERHALHPAAGGPDAHGALFGLPGQAPVVERLRRVGAEGDRRGQGLAQLRFHLGLHRRISVGDLLDDVLGGLGRQAHVLEAAVGVLAQVVVAEHLGLPCGAGDEVGRFVAQAQRVRQRRLLGGRGEQPDLHDELHAVKFTGSVRPVRRRMRFLPALKDRSPSQMVC
ncbi:hypothetical protein ACFYSC_19090 [Streptosporangium sp. NPDC004379]|uniref:hypothetical protein n=1 Tax=Streptosporangium sp. NPDC004379 TaxID=3366189 RepID=UPI0036D16ABE